MDYGTITQLIGSLGFPIVMCGAMFWKMNKQDEEHKEEVQRLTDVVEQNTEALKLLTVHVEGIDRKKE